jgi:hypothetical protein
MKAHVVLGAMSMVVVLTIGALCFAGEQPRPQASSAPTIEGTYKLSSRKLPDGTMQKPPDIMGLQTYTKSHRNFNLVLKDATGTFSSISAVATYKLTATEYSQTRLFSIVNDQIGGKEIVYNLSSEPRSVPVTVNGGRLQFKFGDRPTEVYEGDKMTATAEGRFVDVWEKVQ